MSLHTFEELACPKCGNAQRVQIWQSLNVSIDPEEQQRLFEGRMNVLECSKCGNKTFVNVPFVYHDMHRQFYVQYLPFESLEDDAVFFQFQFQENGFPSVEDDEDMGIPLDSYFRTQHVVFDMAELVRYIIFRERLFEALNKNAEQGGGGQPPTRLESE
jgi:predicted nucleic-acid-binding Zn-ribbon protein